MDREKRRDFVCSGACSSGIFTGVLTCGFSFADAELAQCMGMGGATLPARDPRQNSVSDRRDKRLIPRFAHPVVVLRRKEVASGPISSIFF
jgi:hypothetical protein